MDFECLKNKAKCVREECDLFMRPNDCAPKSWAISLERIATVLEEIVDAMKRQNKK